jgi:hypothetical protein
MSHVLTRVTAYSLNIASVLCFGALCFCVLASPAGRVFCVFVFGLARLRAVFCVFVFWGPCRVMQDTYMYMYACISGVHPRSTAARLDARGKDDALGALAAASKLPQVPWQVP